MANKYKDGLFRRGRQRYIVYIILTTNYITFGFLYLIDATFNIESLEKLFNSAIKEKYIKNQCNTAHDCVT